MMGFGGIGIILIIAAVFFIFKFMPDNKFKSGSEKETPIDILKKRFANGDISKEEFEEKKRAIG